MKGEDEERKEGRKEGEERQRLRERVFHRWDEREEREVSRLPLLPLSPCSSSMAATRKVYSVLSSRPYFWETRLSVYSQLRSRVGNALCCSSKVKGESEEGGKKWDRKRRKNEVAPEKKMV